MRPLREREEGRTAIYALACQQGNRFAAASHRSVPPLLYEPMAHVTLFTGNVSDSSPLPDGRTYVRGRPRGDDSAFISFRPSGHYPPRHRQCIY